MLKLTQKQIREINRLRHLFPDKIMVSVARAKEGGFVAEITTYPGCFTQGETFSELLVMINDCIYTYFDIPEKYIPFMPEYLAPMSLAEHLGIVPTKATLKSIQIQYESVKG